MSKLTDEVKKIQLELQYYKSLENRQHYKTINNEKLFNRIIYWVDSDCGTQIKLNHIKGLLETRRVMEARQK